MRFFILLQDDCTRLDLRVVLQYRGTGATYIRKVCRGSDRAKVLEGTAGTTTGWT